jgi:thioredoxin-related protein
MKRRMFITFVVIGLCAIGLFGQAQRAVAAELIMYEQEGCPACDLWKKQVGEIYPLTDEARVLPLRMVNIYAPLPKDLEFLGRQRFTPYFVVIENGQKIGHIYGYNDEAAFYGMLGELIEKVKAGNKDSTLQKPLKNS